MYTLDLPTMLRLLRDFQRSGILRTEIPAGLPRLKTPCLVMIELRLGEMTACHVKDDKGHILLAGQEAFKAITAAGNLKWAFEELPEHALASTPGANQSSWEVARSDSFKTVPPMRTTSSMTGPLNTPPALPVPRWSDTVAQQTLLPRRLMELTPLLMHDWPRRYRQVYVLIDGVRDSAKIASILNQPVQSVEQILREIQSTGAISLSPVRQ